jgi:amino acid transporter
VSTAVADNNGKTPTIVPRKITLLGLIGATYLIVAGGPFGLEDIVREAGYAGAVIALSVIPFLWSLPSALMVAELSSAIPEEGGYYVWVRRALGPFWGFQEAWLSFTSSVFDMAIYPILFVTYFGFVGKYAAPEVPGWGLLAQTAQGSPGTILGITMIAACIVVNLCPPRSVGRSSLWTTVAMLAPFAVLSLLAVRCGPGPSANAAPAGAQADYVTALLFALWNYMGWDNATTFASDVDRPQRTYPLAMGATVCLVTLTYVLPVLAAARTDVPAGSWETGAWVTIAATVGGRWLAVAIGVGGMISAFGIFNSFVLSYSRIPVVLAQDGYLPGVFLRRTRTGAPWVAVLVCAVAWCSATRLGLKRVLALDVILYGLGLLLEFAAMVALRIREPDLHRPFRVRGGTIAAASLAVAPAMLIGLAIFDQSRKWDADESGVFAPGPALLLGAGLALLGPVLYVICKWHHRLKSNRE